MLVIYDSPKPIDTDSDYFKGFEGCIDLMQREMNNLSQICGKYRYEYGIGDNYIDFEIVI